MTAYRVSVVQPALAGFDGDKAMKAVHQGLIQASEAGTDLVLFPEVCIPGYPRGHGFGMVVGSRSEAGRALWQRYYEAAVSLTDPKVFQLCEWARRYKLFVVIGITERGEEGGTLYCTLLYINAKGKIVGKHRKLKPTGTERMIWGEGEGKDLQLVTSEKMRIGGLICWENYMPLARMALYQQGIELYLAPTADARDTWQATLRHIACEGRCFVLGSNLFTPSEVDIDSDILTQTDVATGPTGCRGGSVIISPMGEILAGPLWDESGILHVDLDPNQLIKAKLDFDVIGHYHRPDVFDFNYRFNE